MTEVAVICGGVGAAKFLRGLIEVVDPATITGIVNTGDDMRLHGLAISPDLDTCTYTLADAINPDTGWGLAGETWQARETLERYGGQTWFGLGDRDLGTHMYRTQRLAEGATLSQVTAEITQAWGIDAHLIPMTDDPVATLVTNDRGETIDFQRYFVERAHRDRVTAIEFEGIEAASPAPGVLAAIESATTIVIAPSNPFVSIAPVLAVPGIGAAVAARRERTVAISPIVGGAAIKGPAAEMMASLRHRVSAVGVASLVAEVAGHLVIDTTDAAAADEVQALGIGCHVTDTMMRSVDIAADLARRTLQATGDQRTPS